MTIKGEDVKRALELMLAEQQREPRTEPREGWKNMIEATGIADPETLMTTAEGFADLHECDGAGYGLVVGFCAGARAGRMEAARMIDGKAT